MYSFTSISDLDCEIFKYLSDDDLKMLSCLNKFNNKLLKNENFWRNRTNFIFSEFMPIVRIKEYYNRYKYTSWKEYYFSLFDLKTNREDRSLMLDYVKINTDHLIREIKCHYKNGKWKKMLGQKFINPNNIFYDVIFTFGCHLRGTDKIDLLLYLLDHRKVDPSLHDNFVLSRIVMRFEDFFDDDDRQIFVLKKLLEDKRVNTTKILEIILRLNDYICSKEIVNLILEHSSINNLLLSIENASLYILNDRMVEKFCNLIIMKGGSIRQIKEILPYIKDSEYTDNFDIIQLIYNLC